MSGPSLAAASPPEADGVLRESELVGDVPLLAPAWVLSERVYRAILQMLARGTLRRGATLHIGVLAKALGVSQTPVREALARLAATGLVVHEARKGYRIAPPLDAAGFRQLMDARRLVEIGAIGHACRLGGPAFRAELSKAFDTQSAEVSLLHAAHPVDRAERARLEWRVLEADLHFHEVILDHSHNRFIRFMADALKAQLHRIRQSAEQGLVDHGFALAEHRAILEAVMSADAAAAEGAMRRHMDLVEERALAEIALAARAGTPEHGPSSGPDEHQGERR